MNTDNKAKQSESRLWLAVTLSMTMIFTSYAISAFNHQEDQHVNVHSPSYRPVVVSYLA